MKRERNNSAKTKPNKKIKKNPSSAKNVEQTGPKSKNKKDKTSKFQKPIQKDKTKNSGPNKFKKAKVSQKGKPNLDRKKELGNKDTTGEKPNWLEYKKQQKDLREKRRAKKLDDAYDIAVQAKKIGEQLRRINLSDNDKEKLTKKFHDLVQNHYEKMIFTHDLSRVIQWQVKYSNSDIQLAIIEELKSHTNEMFTSKYAKNIIRTLLKSGSENVKRVIVQSCDGHVMKLLSNVISAPIFEKIYVEVASDKEKINFKQEFYGDLYRKSKDPNVKTLIDTYKDFDGMKSAILSAVKANLIKILNKNLINSTLVHTVLYEYLTNCSKEDRAEIIVMVRPLICELSQTKEGSKAGNICIWHGTNKDRKHIMKTLKEHVKDIVTSEHGHLMILALLDSIDDTVLLKKILLQEVLNNLSDIIKSEYGKRVILYIVARRDTRFFHPSLINYLKKGDGNEASKKPNEIREKELLENVIDSLLSNIAIDLHTWLSDGPMQLATLGVLKAARGEKPKEVFDAIAKFITDSGSKLKKDEETFNAIEHPGLHIVLKKLIQLDKIRTEENELTFGEILVEHLSSEVLEYWFDFNRACFLLVLLFENETKDTVTKLKTKFQNISKLKSQNSRGATILIQKINSCK